MVRALFNSRIFTTSLTIFAMLFGAGNLIYPPKIGVDACGHIAIGFIGFALTGVLLPMLGILAIVAFEGDCETFFGRLGRIPGGILVFICMMALGPLYVLPRIMSLAYKMLNGFLPTLSFLPFGQSSMSIVFPFLFALIAFFATYRLGRVLDLLGRILSPLKVLGIAFLLLAGIWFSGGIISCEIDTKKFFMEAFVEGYGTLDLIGGIFFGSIIVRLLSRYARAHEQIDLFRAMTITGISGVVAGTLLGLVYFGMIYLGSAYGSDLHAIAEGDVLPVIVERIIGTQGLLLIGLIIFLAGLTTLVSLTVVVGEYLQRLSGKKLGYSTAVALVLFLSALIASCGLTAILTQAWPFIIALYPLVIVLTVCNLLYKFFGFTFVKLPVMLTAVLSAVQLLSQFGITFW